MQEKVLNIIKNAVADIPEGLTGTDRFEYIVKIAEKTDLNDKSMLAAFFNAILTEMLKRKASDIEFGGHGTKNRIWLRIFGRKEPVGNLPSFNEDEAAFLIAVLLSARQCEYLLENRNLDFSYTFLNKSTGVKARFRADVYFEMDTVALNMRAISAEIREIESLEFHKNALRVMNHQHYKFGLSLITGITGSGKSSTLDTIIDFHNNTDNAHLVIIASPVEYVHKSNKCIIRHREVGKDVPSFGEGVIQSLRQDPDIIVIGEMRDPETIMAALEVSDTGHKVFSTLHTSSATESIDRIIAEVNPVEQARVRNRLADVLLSVVSQKLVPSLDGRRVLAKEVLVVNPSVKAAIKNNNISEIYGMINMGAQSGMITLEQDLLRLYRTKMISKENAVAYANNKKRLVQLMNSI